GALAQDAAAHERLDRIDERHVAARDRGCPGAPVRLQYIAVGGDGALPQRLHVDHCAQRTAYQSLDFEGAPALLADGGLTAAARMAGARQHAVFVGNPAAAGVAQKTRDALLDARSAKHARIAELHKHRPFGVAREAAGDSDGPQLIVSAAAGAWFHGKRIADGG